MPYQPELFSLFKPTLNEALQSNWTYTSNTDTLAQMTAPGYFDPALEQPASSSQTGENLAQTIKVNDRISLVATDGVAQLVVSSLDPVTLSGAPNSIVASGQFLSAGGANVAIPDAAIPANGIGWVSFESAANPAYDIAVLVTGGQIGITYNVDPGVCTINYFVAAQ